MTELLTVPFQVSLDDMSRVEISLSLVATPTNAVEVVGRKPGVAIIIWQGPPPRTSTSNFGIICGMSERTARK